ncbi:hypothetical protein EVAR_3757_1 [Eumeta japonica]|uniref:Uncharacterized protein n=1 Tax=Eumeta variegata TaxID=151549 RepID=A0A4C1SSG6_EUMVA|nr:hypothetical protein EVAR_3757_1 [Eumeta japonica]
MDYYRRSRLDWVAIGSTVRVPVACLPLHHPAPLYIAPSTSHPPTPLPMKYPIPTHEASNAEVTPLGLWLSMAVDICLFIAGMLVCLSICHKKA